MAHLTQVSICVATYRRPEGLARLLDGIADQQFTDSDPPQVEIIVVDNDPDKSGCTPSLDRSGRWPVLRVPEPRRGICVARNTGVQQALARGAELVGFLDDDEVPEPGWLDELMRVMALEEADVATGPVLPVFEVEPPAWIRRGRFLELPRYTTGTLLDRAYTGNALVGRAVLEEFPEPFDETRSLSGGEDVEFFLRVTRAGYRIVWADGAVVHESTPPERSSARWILRRAFQVGNNWSTLEKGLHPSARIATRGLAKGLLLLPWSLFLGRHGVVSALRPIANSVGYFAGRIGFRMETYRREDGD
jgi:glycosyltransferase involved in cell wall biosynthesis